LRSEEVGPRDEDAAGPAPDDHALVARHVSAGRDLVIEGAVRRLEWPQIEAWPLVPLSSRLAREVHVDVRCVRDHHVLEANEALDADGDEPDRPLPAEDGSDVPQLA